MRRIAQHYMRWTLLCMSPLLIGSCSAPAQGNAKSASPTKGEPVRFSYFTPDGQPINSEWARGRATLLLFITTYDLASQLEAKRVNELVMARVPRINAVAVILEVPTYAAFAPAFSESLGLRYPVVFAGQVKLEDDAGLGPVNLVPTLVLLDPAGFVTWRHEGPAERREIEAALDAIVRGRTDEEALPTHSDMQ